MSRPPRRLPSRPLIECLEREEGVPLLTYSNHISTIDDPVIWTPLSLKYLVRKDIRWNMAAHDICYSTVPHSIFFMLSRAIPTIRGAGVYQEGVDFAIERLTKGEWVHIFPEGKVNEKMEYVRLKWGVGRMIFESPVTPIILPVHLIGLQKLLPPRPPYFVRPFQRVTINYGEVLDLRELVSELKESKASPEKARKTITDALEEELMEMKEATIKLHGSTEVGNKSDAS